MVYGRNGFDFDRHKVQWGPQSWEGIAQWFGITAFLFCVHSMVCFIFTTIQNHDVFVDVHLCIFSFVAYLIGYCVENLILCIDYSLYCVLIDLCVYACYSLICV